MLSDTNKGIDSVLCLVTFQLGSCSGNKIFQVICSLVSGCWRGEEELTVTVKSMAKLRIDQKCNGDDLSKTLSRGVSPYYQTGIEAMIIQNFISFSMGADT